MYGIPEAAMISVESTNETKSVASDQQYYCIDCAIEGEYEPLNMLYLVKGTIYCFNHAKVHYYD